MQYPSLLQIVHFSPFGILDFSRCFNIRFLDVPRTGNVIQCFWQTRSSNPDKVGLLSTRFNVWLGSTMLTVQVLGINSNCQAHLDSHQLNEHAGTLRHTKPLSTSISSANYVRGPSAKGVQSCSFSQDFFTHLRTYHFSQQNTTKRWMCRSQDSLSPDDEYRSSRNIAISLFRRYRSFVERGGVDNLKEFINAGVNAYALGCTDEGLRTELTQLKESGAEIEALQTYGGTTSLKYKIFNKEVDECILWLSIVFITILCTPQPTVARWSSTPPVLEEMMLQWKGFCAIIANAYYVRGMACCVVCFPSPTLKLPVKTLQLEQMAVVGYAEEPSLVASRMRLVLSTLEKYPKEYSTWREDPSNFIVNGIYPVQLWGTANEGENFLVVTNKSLLQALICTALELGPERGIAFLIGFS